MLAVAFQGCDWLELRLWRGLVPDLDDAVAATRVQELLGFVRLQHVDMVIVGCHASRDLWEAWLGQVVEAKVLVSGSTDERRPVVQHG